jgi:hypothetical protein
MALNTGSSHLAEKLLRHIVSKVVMGRKENWQAQAIFIAIKYMFDGSGAGHYVTTDSYLVHNLAACAEIALGYNVNEEIPWDKGDHDHIIVRTLNGMVQTLIHAVQTDCVKKVGDKTYFGHFEIPEWLIDEAKG